VNKERQQGPHPHQVAISPDNRFVLVPDLGLDHIRVYGLDSAKGALTPGDPAFVQVEPGSGPRHLVFHPNGRFAYLINELKSTVTVFAYDAGNGRLNTLQTIPALPKSFTGTSTAAEIAVDRGGNYLYASNRGADDVAIFAIDARRGTLSLVGHVPTQGKDPRNFSIDPTGNYLLAANQTANNIVLFRLNPKTGGLTAAGAPLDVPAPVCLTFLKAE
jgi:6-phosphogluconolactonase